MEPLSSLSLAGTLLEFVEFACRTVAIARQVKSSHDSHTLANADIGQRVKRAEFFYHRLTDDHLFKAGQLSDEEVCIKQVGERCRIQVRDLQQLLNTLTTSPNGKPLSKVVTTVKSLWSESQIRRLEDGLRKSTNELHFFLTVALYHRASNSTKAVQGTLPPSRCEAIDSQHAFTEMRQAIDDLRDKINCSNALTQYFPVYYSQSGTQGHATGEEAFLLSFLFDPGMRRRYDDVSRAHQGSFEWIFKDEHERRPVNFSNWLRDGSGIHWITGIPGSGKTTLMKYICEHPSTRHELGVWNGGQEPIIANFFF